MNLKQLTSAIVIGLASAAAFAIEATPLDVPPPSTLTLAEVIAELERARLDGTPMSGDEATVFVDRPVAQATRSREEVRREALMAARERRFGEHHADAHIGG